MPRELDALLEVYRAANPRRVLEIGCWDGGTLREWLTQLTPEIVVAVDLEHRNPKAYERWRQPETELVVITGSSWDAKVVKQIRAHAPYDWAFIDGDHGDYGVRRDVATVRPLVSPGGHMVLHDIQAGSDFDGVYPPGVVLAELEAAGYETERFVFSNPQRWSHGIGVVRM